MGFPEGPVVKNPPTNAGDSRDVDLIPGLGKSPGIRNGNPLHYSCLENFLDRGKFHGHQNYYRYPFIPEF